MARPAPRDDASDAAGARLKRKAREEESKWKRTLPPHSVPDARRGGKAAKPGDKPEKINTIAGEVGAARSGGTIVAQAAVYFEARFGVPWERVVQTFDDGHTDAPLRRAVRGRGTRWRASLIELLDLVGLTFRTHIAGREIETKIPTMKRWTIVKMGRGRRPLNVPEGSDHFLTPLDFALVAILLGKVRQVRGRSFRATVEAEAEAMRKTIERHHRPGAPGPNSRLRGPLGSKYPFR